MSLILRKILVAALMMAICVGTALAEEKTTQQASEKVPETVAIVNGDKISGADFERQYTAMKQNFYIGRGKTITPEEDKSLRQGVLDNLIAGVLLSQEAKKKNIQVSDEDIDKQIDAFAQRVGGKDTLEEKMKESGVTMSDLKEKVRQRLLTEKLVEQESASAVAPTKEEEKEYYDTHPSQFDMPKSAKTSHILIKLSPQATDEEKAAARKKIDAILERAKKGEDFAQLAKETSEGPSAPNGGDLGWVTPGKMMQSFEQATFSLEPGQISDVVSTVYGLHIIKVYEVREARHAPFEEVQENIELMLKRQKLRPWLKTYVDGLRAQAKVETFM